MTPACKLMQVGHYNQTIWRNEGPTFNSWSLIDNLVVFKRAKRRVPEPQTKVRCIRKA